MYWRATWSVTIGGLVAVMASPSLATPSFTLAAVTNNGASVRFLTLNGLGADGSMVGYRQLAGGRQAVIATTSGVTAIDPDCSQFGSDPSSINGYAYNNQFTGVASGGLMVGTATQYDSVGSLIGDLGFIYQPGKPQPLTKIDPVNRNSNGSGSSSINAFNNNGVVIGSAQYYATPTSDPADRAFYWSNSELTDVGAKLATEKPAVTSSTLTAVNANGVALGTYTTTSASGFTYAPSTGIHYLSTSTALTNVSPTLINTNGTVAGTATVNGSKTQMVMWKGSSILNTTTGGTGTTVNAMNDSDVVVGAMPTASGTHGMLWDGVNPVIDVGVGPVNTTHTTVLKSGKASSTLSGINNRGLAAGTYTRYTSDSTKSYAGTGVLLYENNTPYFIDPAPNSANKVDSVLTLLPNQETLPNRDDMAFYSITIYDGLHTYNPTDTHAYVWTPDGGLVDLNTVVALPADWICISAITATDGAGDYTANGYLRTEDGATVQVSGMLTIPVPEPTMLGIIALSGLLLGRRSRQA